MRTWAPAPVLESAKRAAERGAVTSASFDPSTRTARGIVVVNGSEIHSGFRISPPRPGWRPVADTLCTCSAGHDGNMCFHAMAVAFVLARRAESARNDPAREKERERAERIARNSAAGLSLAVDDATGVPISIWFELPSDWRARFLRLRGGADETLDVPIWARPEDGSGGALVPVPDLVAGRTKIRFPVAAERDLLYALEEMSEADLSHPLRLNAAYFLWLVGAVAKLGRPMLVRGGTPLVAHAASEALAAHLFVSLDRESGELLLSLRNSPPQGHDPDLPPDGYLDWGRYAYAQYGSNLYPLSNPLPAVYAQVYYKDVVPIPRLSTRNFILHELPALKTKFDVRLDEGLDPDFFTWLPAEPALRLVADIANPDPARQGIPRSNSLRPDTTLSFRLEAVYGDTVICANAPAKDISLPDEHDVFLYRIRNVRAEREALARLEALGIADPEAPRGDALRPMHGPDAILGFLATTVPSLRSLPGWCVVFGKALGDVDSHVERVATILHVSKPPEAPGCFDVSYRFGTVTRSRNVLESDMAAARLSGKPWLGGRATPTLFDPAALDAFHDLLRECGARAAHPDERTSPMRLGNARAAFFARRVKRLEASNVVFDPASRKWAGEALSMESSSGAREDAARVAEPLRSMLRPYQRRGVAWLRGLERGGFSGILADEMGLGKTVQTLAWLSLERVNPAHRGLPALVVCPTSLVGNWAEEAAKFVPQMRLLPMSGETREALMSEGPSGRTLDPDKFATALMGADLVVASYATLRRDIAVYERNGFSACVLDEAQNIKNRATQNAECVKRVPAALRLAVTGTPIENSPADLWSIEDFLMRGYLGDWNDFRSRYETPISLGAAPDRTVQQAREAREALDRLRDLVRPYLLRRLKTDVAKDLPPKTVQVVFPELGPEQRAVYTRYFKAARTQVSDAIAQSGFARSRMLVLTALLRLRQAACHLALLGDADVRKSAPAHPSAKLEWLLEFLAQAQEEGHRVLVFSQFVEMLKLVREALDARGTKYCYLDGTSKDRAEQVHLFNATPSIPVFLISLKAGGTGLNLTGADEVVLFDPWWNPAVEDQAVDRAHRIGQTRNVRAIKLVARGTVEEKVFAMQRRKRAVIAATVQTSDEAALAALDESDVRKLFDL